MPNGRSDFKDWAFGGGKLLLWSDDVCLWIVSYFGVFAFCVFDAAKFNTGKQTDVAKSMVVVAENWLMQSCRKRSWGTAFCFYKSGLLTKYIVVFLAFI